jgi:hypothetical protein
MKTITRTKIYLPMAAILSAAQRKENRQVIPSQKVNLNAKEMAMKHSTIAKTFTIAAVAALALCIAPTAKADDRGCSNASLIGTFAYTATGSIVKAPAPVGPEAEVGTQTFDGKGATTGAATLVDATGAVHQLTITGTYTVNPDCTGTFTLQVAPLGSTVPVFFVIDDNWLGFQAIQTGGSGVVTRIGRKLYTGRSI